MARQKHPKTEVARAAVDKYHNSPSKTIAHMLYIKHPKLFDSVEDARSAVRRVRGAAGAAHRNDPIVTHPRPLKAPGSPFDKLPQPKEEYSDWDHVCIGGPRRVLILADAHVPFYDRQALNVALSYGLERGADTILLNGDILDCFSVSSFQRDPRLVDFKGELGMCRDVLGAIRELFPKAQIVFKLGNHEERLVNYLRVKAPELLDLESIQLGALLEFQRLNILEVGEMRPIRLGKLIVLHGHEYRFPIANPVNPARGLFTRALGHAWCNHMHRTSSHAQKSLDQTVIGCWSGGCLCNMHPGYRPINDWNLGFGFVDVQDAAGQFEVHNLKIIGGKAYAS